jgi:hypothetical protein
LVTAHAVSTEEINRGGSSLLYPQQNDRSRELPGELSWLVEPRNQLNSGQFDGIGVNIVVGLICATSP